MGFQKYTVSEDLVVLRGRKASVAEAFLSHLGKTSVSDLDAKQAKALKDELAGVDENEEPTDE